MFEWWVDDFDLHSGQLFSPQGIRIVSMYRFLSVMKRAAPTLPFLSLDLRFCSSISSQVDDARSLSTTMAAPPIRN